MRRDLARAALYAGGFLGPLGGGVVTVLIPELRDVLHTSTTGAAATLSVYLVPFALLQLVSGTIGERIGLARTVRTAYVAYALASVGVSLTHTLEPFLVFRALQGSANAFITPLLVAALAELADEGALGRAMGTFASIQTGGVVFAPLIGGLAGAIDYRVAFLAPAGVALLLAAAPLPAGTRREEVVTVRAALTRRTMALAAFAFAGYLSTVGMAFMVSLRAADSFGVGATGRGLLLAGFGAAGVLVGRPVGGLIDRVGPVRVIAAGALASAVIVPLVGLAGTAAELAVAWTLAGFASSLIWSVVYTLAVGAAPGNRAGAVSIVGAARFGGNAVGPLLWLPLYHADYRLPFATAGLVMAALWIAIGRARSLRA